MEFLLHSFKSDHHLYFHTFRNDEVKIPAYADDLAYLANALIGLSAALADTNYLLKAKEIVDYLFSHFKREGQILLDFTHAHYKQVAVDKQDVYDGGTAIIECGIH